MAKCISCGKEAGEGQFFCRECLVGMTPEQAEPTPATMVPTVKPEPPATPARPEAPAVPPGTTAREEEEAPAPEEPAAGEAARPRIDAERSKILTPASEKKKVPAAGETARPRIDAERSKAITPASEKKSVKPEAPPVGAPVKPRREARPAREKKPKKQKAERLPPAERVKQGLKRQASRLASSLRSYRTRAAGWVKKQAFHERCPFDRTGWVSWSAGLTAVVLLMASVLFFTYYTYEWIRAGSEEIIANKVSIMGIDLGGWGVALLIDAVLLLLLYAWSLAGLKWKPKLKINPDFLAACLGLIGVLFVFMAIHNNVTLKYAIVEKTGLLYNLLESGAMDYSVDKLSYGPYISLFALMAVFVASATRLSDKEASSKLGKKLSSWLATKKRGSHA